MPEFEESATERTLTSDQKKEFKDKVKQSKDKGGGAGVIYIGHIPHGFVEKPMKEYFKQFGTVSRLRISRSKKTGKPKGYAFVEFKTEAVAKIVADSMNNYLMFHRLLKCQFMPLSRVHPETFKGSGRKFAKPKSHTMAKDRHNSFKSEKQQKSALRKLKAKKAKSMAKLAEMGVTYECPGIVGKADIQKVLDKKKMEAESEEETQPESLSQDKISSKVRQFLDGLKSDDDSSEDDFLKDSDNENEGNSDASEEKPAVVVRSSKRQAAKKTQLSKPTGKAAKRKAVASPGKKTTKKSKK